MEVQRHVHFALFVGSVLLVAKVVANFAQDKPGVAGFRVSNSLEC
jgi:hypothetical protein